MNATKTKNHKRAFTIVELLTVMGVIAILISLLVPALTLVRDYAKEIQQRAQFHSLSVGLELFKNDFGDYPPSYDRETVKPAPAVIDDAHTYSGANKLAEAMVGLDYLGFHPNSDFRGDGRNDVIGLDGALETDMLIYSADQGQANWQTADENVKARKGPYLDLENANAFWMIDVWEAATVASEGFRSSDVDGNGVLSSLVLCDEYAEKRQSGKKTGMPILYFKARTQYTEQAYDVLPAAAPGWMTDGIDNDIYYFPDNENILALNVPGEDTIHPLFEAGGAEDDWQKFENMIINEQVETIRRPYRAESFILISAGKDGLYGTPDDMFNFRKETQ